MPRILQVSALVGFCANKKMPPQRSLIFSPCWQRLILHFQLEHTSSPEARAVVRCAGHCVYDIVSL